MCGVVAPQETEAPEGKVLIALQILDMILAEKAGTSRFTFLTPQHATFTYAANADSVDVTSLLGANKLDFVRAAYNDDTSDEITLLRRDEWDLFQNGLYCFGTARALYIADNNVDTYTAFLLPKPTVDFKIRLTGNKFPNDVAKATKSASDVSHGFGVAWQRWMTYALAIDCGSGPLARLPEDRLNDWRVQAQLSWIALQAYRGGGQRKRGRFTRAYDG